MSPFMLCLIMGLYPLCGRGCQTAPPRHREIRAGSLSIIFQQALIRYEIFPCIVYDDMQGKCATNTYKGRKAEQIARARLVELGWLIIDCNQYFAGSELDLIALDTQKILVFIEVKSVWGTSSGRPQAQVHRKKQIHLWRAARAWIAHYHVKEQRMRFDVIAIRMKEDGIQFEHLRDAFVGPSSSY